MKKINAFKVVLSLSILLMGIGCDEEKKEFIESENSMTLKSTCSSTDPTVPVDIIPVVVDGNTPAVTSTNVKIDPPVAGTYALGAGTVTIAFSNESCGQVMTWEVSDNIVIDHVYAKGGDKYNDYDYTGESPKPKSDGNLHCPVNPSGSYADFSHVNFVFHYQLTVLKTAEAEFTRKWDWLIDKVADKSELVLSEGQVFNVNYDVTTTASAVDSDWKVSGTITILNETPLEAVVTDITDIAGGVTATLACELPQTLAPGETLECDYYAEQPSGMDGTNTVTVVTSTPLVEGGIATADYTFGEPTNEIDECITVSDDKFGGLLGNICGSDSPYIFEYTLSPPSECGEYEFTNTASFETNDTQTLGSDDWTISVTVPCDNGCTLTQGYWKTHSEFGPAPYDDTWAQLPQGASTGFFSSGQSYYQVLWTPPAGNAYYQLAHQYIAAELNMLNGASNGDIIDAFNEATNLFEEYSPDEVASFKGKDKNMWTKLASTLDAYNNGIIGPGSCDEEVIK